MMFDNLLKNLIILIFNNYYGYRLMSLSIENFLEELKEIPNNKEKYKKFSEIYIKKFFRSFIEEHPRKLIFMHKALIVNLQKYVNVNNQLIKSNYSDENLSNNP